MSSRTKKVSVGVFTYCQPPGAKWKADAKHAAAGLTPRPEQKQATADIHEFFRRVTRRLADADLADVKTLADWQRLRPQYRERVLEMLGLSPLPPKTDLK